MSDSLRDRIAAVLVDAGLWDFGVTDDKVLPLADAVIRELDANYILVPKSHSVEVECAVCHRTYSVRADSPGWSSVWTCCISCQANEDVTYLNRIGD